jgi:predicted nucleotide-binding protein
VFVIHGRDEINQLRLSKLLREDFNLSPVVLLDKPGRSASTIDKFEEHARTCSYAIALFTADDKVTTKTGDQYWQPRPNVIFETGWFVGRLGQECVLILLQDGVKIYSDFDGVNRIHFQSDVEDKFRAIRAELEAAQLIRAE